MKRFITFALLALAVPAVVYATVAYLEDFNSAKVGTPAANFSSSLGTFSFTQTNGIGGGAVISSYLVNSGNSMALFGGTSGTSNGVLGLAVSIQNQTVVSFKYNAVNSGWGPAVVLITGTQTTYQQDLTTDSNTHVFTHNHPDPIVSVQIVAWDHQSVYVDDIELTTCENCE